MFIECTNRLRRVVVKAQHPRDIGAALASRQHDLASPFGTTREHSEQLERARQPELPRRHVARDEAEGVESKPLSDEQKAAIAEARNLCEARTAEREILYKSKLMTTVDPNERATLDEEYRRDRERYVSDRDAKTRRIRDSA